MVASPSAQSTAFTQDSLNLACHLWILPPVSAWLQICSQNSEWGEALSPWNSTTDAQAKALMATASQRSLSFFLWLFMHFWAEQYFPNMISSNPGCKYRVVTDIFLANAAGCPLRFLLLLLLCPMVFLFFNLTKYIKVQPYLALQLTLLPETQVSHGTLSDHPCLYLHPPTSTLQGTWVKIMSFFFSSQNFKLTPVAEYDFVNFYISGGAHSHTSCYPNTFWADEILSELLMF